jgi:CubicO group peptidase (beta-lactamase class C family)
LDALGDRAVFRLASMSKPVTTVATLIQVGKGLIDLDEPIDRFLPKFATVDVGRVDTVNGERKLVRVEPTARKLTPRMLLNHTSGLGSMEVGDIQFAALMKDPHCACVGEVVDYLADTALAFQPTTGQYYSPIWAFDVLARLVELTSDMPFAEFLKARIFDPCGMTDTTFDPTADQWSRMIAMHGRVEDADGTSHSVDAPVSMTSVFEALPCAWCSGGAGLAATLPDYVRFAEMLRRGGRTASGVEILPAAMVCAMGTPTVPTSIMADPQRWGLGVRVITADGHWLPRGCFGWSGAYGTHFWVDPANDIIAVYMKNSRYDGGSGAVTAAHFEQDVYAALI